MSGLKQPSKIIEMEKEKESEKDKEIEPVDLSLAKSVAMMTDSEETEPLSKVLELTDEYKSDEESMSNEDILKQIPEGMMLPSVTAAEITRINSDLELRFRESTKVIGTRPVSLGLLHQTRGRRLPVLDSIKYIIAKEEQILAWTETDSLETAVRRREYIIAKYGEMLLRKFFSSSIHPDPTTSESFSQRNPDTFFNSPSQRTSTDSRMLFTIDDIPLGIETAVDQILMLMVLEIGSLSK
ncbi:hypothetical protein F511_42484 [Dorcoceras hygrometricum]|uniref:Uncharacterized protein n=1 Tax=Dorcoceras hygrometricum TaxID=472368 RepID=A0A2Z7C8B1_9LAMI|nr:hypothetical protein F511_42484 [Dorcoceras hygrometricum]